jgi:hypothetical protein
MRKRILRAAALLLAAGIFALGAPTGAQAHDRGHRHHKHHKHHGHGRSHHHGHHRGYYPPAPSIWWGVGGGWGGFGPPVRHPFHCGSHGLYFESRHGYDSHMHHHHHHGHWDD